MSKSAALILLLDAGGVFTSSRQHTVAFQQLVGAYFAPLLGILDTLAIRRDGNDSGLAGLWLSGMFPCVCYRSE